MAAKPLDRTIAEDIVTDWRLGQLSQRQIADKRKVSLGMVNKLCKDVARDVEPIVNAGIQYHQALHTQDERIVNAVEQVVNEAANRMEWLNKAALKNVQEAMEAKCNDQQDYKARADTVLKAKEAVFGKTPDTAIQINNQQTSITQEQFRQAAREVLDSL